MFDTIRSAFENMVPAVDFCSLRVCETRSDFTSVRQNVVQPVSTRFDRGAMIVVIHRGGYGYAATGNLTESGLQEALNRARHCAALCARYPVMNYSTLSFPSHSGSYESQTSAASSHFSRRDLIEMLQSASVSCPIHEYIVDWKASLWHSESEHLFLTNTGSRIEQRFRYVFPNFYVTASNGNETQTRRFGGGCFCRQGDQSVLLHCGLLESGPRLAEEALELLAAPDCPAGIMDVLLMPSQMMLQIHESIGHPLELDRILGDERNFAGTSFVTEEMFGRYRYGSDCLNVTFDPTHPEQFASYGWDDDGSVAEKQFLIRRGILERPLGGAVSQARSGLPGVAAARACNWNRPPVDRMANLNIEAGDSSLKEMIESVEHGIVMDTNVSWSIDDSRNKFQFGCEYGRLIENGKLTAVVKNPNYRGISASFWRNLCAVGDRSTFEVMGTPSCGKAEPSQQIHVGHASPGCLFSEVDVFGGSD